MRNEGFTYRERIGETGSTVLAHLAARHRHTSEDGWRARIAAGEVRLDGTVTAERAILRAGQELSWSRPPWEEPEVPREVGVAYEDGEVLVVDKPSGLPTLPAAGYLAQTLLAIVRERWPGATPMHRLGRATSGLLLFGLTPAARKELQAAFRAGKIEKRYRAVASGIVAEDELLIETPIGEVPHPRLGTVHAASPQGKPSRSRARVIERRADTTVLEVDIDTGRPHQIRIHLASIGHPLAGDPLYGPGGVPLPGTVALPGDPGYDLRAVRLAFPHPSTGARIVVLAG